MSSVKYIFPGPRPALAADSIFVALSSIADTIKRQAFDSSVHYGHVTQLRITRFFPYYDIRIFLFFFFFVADATGPDIASQPFVRAYRNSTSGA